MPIYILTTKLKFGHNSKFANVRIKNTYFGSKYTQSRFQILRNKGELKCLYTKKGGGELNHNPPPHTFRS